MVLLIFLYVSNSGKLKGETTAYVKDGFDFTVKGSLIEVLTEVQVLCTSEKQATLVV